MKESFVVNADVRADQGKGASRRLRRAGKVPAILYGGKKEPQMLAIDQHEMANHMKTEAFYSHILTLKVNGADEQAVLKDVQRHPVKPILIHLDFQRVLADQVIHMQVPLHFVNEDKCPGVKTGGGLVEHHMIQVDVECLPGDLPEFIEVDLSQLNINESVHLSQLAVPAGVTLVELKHGNDASVAAVHLPRVHVEEEAPVAETPPGEVPASSVKTEEAKPEGADKADDKKK
jgi:large subunit ribosomal protein L25